MYVCICKAVNEARIHEAAENGACRLRDLRDGLSVCSGCGKCAGHAKQVLETALNSQSARAQNASRAA
ncbi:MAG: (2Fe-2S)-binding protein [Gammaproteobacteria bacterium]|nr:(2Fe-2S)-binding protein [Gammaproteobacteria bacterium]